MSEERRQNLAKKDRKSYYSQEEQLEEFLDDKGAFCNGSESDDSENDDENYTEKSSLSQMFFRIGILKNFANFLGKHLCWNFFLIKLQILRLVTLLKTDSYRGAFLRNV